MGLGALVAFLVSILILATVRETKPHERLAVYRMGRLRAIREPGVSLIVPGLDRTARFDLDLLVPSWRDLESTALDEAVAAKIPKRFGDECPHAE